MSSGVIKPKIIFFGNEQIATGVATEAPVLSMLIDEGYDVKMVIVNQTKLSSGTTKSLAVQKIARNNNIPFYTPLKLSELHDDIAGSGSAIGVLVAFGQMVPQSIIDLFPLGIVNIHPSELPKHRGPTPIESVMLNGETTTAVSLMQLSQKMDAGPIYAQSEPIEVSGQTKQVLADELLELGKSMLKTILPMILSDKCTALPQEDSFATYDKTIKKQDGVMDFSKTAIQLEREVRAYATWPKSRMVIGGLDVVVTQTSLANENEITEAKRQNGDVFAHNKQLYVRTSKDYLIIERLKPAGKQEMTAEAFLAGYGQRL